MRHSIFLKSLVILVGVAAVGGAAFVAFRHASEVRGDTEIPVVPDTAPETADTLGGEDPGAYLSALRTDDYTTYTHPLYGFSFIYPRAFAVDTTSTAEVDETSVRHPRLPLGITVYVRPIEGSEELVERLSSLPDEYDGEPPEGAESEAVMWIIPDEPDPGQNTAYIWFADQHWLYEVQLYAPDTELLQLWARQFLYDDFTLHSR